MKSYSRTNGQPKSPLTQSPSSTPSSPSHPVSVSARPGHAYSSVGSSQSPVHKPGGGVKKVTGVGGTTYEISVWELGSRLTSPLSTAEPWICLLYLLSQSRDSLHCWKCVEHSRHLFFTNVGVNEGLQICALLLYKGKVWKYWPPDVWSDKTVEEGEESCLYNSWTSWLAVNEEVWHLSLADAWTALKNQIKKKVALCQLCKS